MASPERHVASSDWSSSERLKETRPSYPRELWPAYSSVRTFMKNSPGGVQEGLWVEQPTGPLALSFRRCANAESSAAGVPLVQCA